MRSIDRSEIVSAWSKNQFRPVERNVPVDALEHVERARDRLVIGRVQPPRPAVLRQDAHDLFELALHLRRHVGTRLAEILEVGRREDQHLAGAVVAEVVVALLVFRRLRPVEEILLLALRLLREEIVGEADRELAVVGQLLDDRVVLRIVLKAAAGVDRAGHAEAVELAHEMARRVELILERQLRALGERRVEDAGIRLGEQQPGRIACGVAHDLAARRIGRVLGVADRAQRGAVEQRAVIEMQEEDRRVGRDGVELLDRRQALLGELMLGEAADHAHPLRRRRDRRPAA